MAYVIAGYAVTIAGLALYAARIVLRTRRLAPMPANQEDSR
jgi:hypothetical protein